MTNGLRWVCAGVFVAWMVLGPVYRQAFAGTHKAFPAWHMFRGFGVKVWRVEIWQETDEGPVPLDRLAWLGYDDWREAPLGIRKISSQAELDAQLAHICAQLGEADVRVRAWRGRVSGWQPVHDGSVDVCR